MAVYTNFAEDIIALIDDLTTAEKVTLDNALFTKNFEVSDFANAHRVITGVREGQVVPILSNAPNYAAFPYKDPTSCTVPACDLDIDFAAKEWQVGQIACKITICMSSFDENFLLFWGEYRRVFSDNDLNSAFMQYMTDKVNRDLQAALWRVAYFGDRSTSSVSPAYQYLRPIDGIFTQAEAGNGYNIEISENASTTPMTGEQAYEYLLQAYNIAAESPWFDPANMVFEVTAAFGSVLIGWYNSLSDRSPYNCECYSADGVSATRNWNMDGVTKVFGIPVIIRREFDGVINTFNLGRRYRALLTTKDNILFGTAEQDQLKQFRIWYSQDDNNIYIEAGAQVAATLVVDDYVYLGAENDSTPST